MYSKEQQAAIACDTLLTGLTKIDMAKHHLFPDQDHSQECIAILKGYIKEAEDDTAGPRDPSDALVAHVCKWLIIHLQTKE